MRASVSGGSIGGSAGSTDGPRLGPHLRPTRSAEGLGSNPVYDASRRGVGNGRTKGGSLGCCETWGQEGYISAMDFGIAREAAQNASVRRRDSKLGSMLSRSLLGVARTRSGLTPVASASGGRRPGPLDGARRHGAQEATGTGTRTGSRGTKGATPHCPTNTPY